MTTLFDITAPLPTTATEGTVYTFMVMPKAALSGPMTVRWEIVLKGELPMTASDFDALTGEVSFAAGDTAGKPASFTPKADGVLERPENFELRVYQVVEGGDDEPLGTQQIVLSSSETGSSETESYGQSEDSGNAAPNIFTYGASASTPSADGRDNGDFYIISRYQYGNVTITDLSLIHI